MSSVVVAIPSQDHCPIEFALSLLHMATTTIQEDSDLELLVTRVTSSILLNARHILACDALSTNATHILWIDSDMIFPPDTLLRLLARNVDLVGANCVARRPPFPFTAKDSKENRLATTSRTTGLEEVFGVGLALFLMKTQILRELTPPWFTFDWKERLFAGEDYGFCSRVRARGHRIWIDHDLSKEVKHVGSFAFGIEQGRSGPVRTRLDRR